MKKNKVRSSIIVNGVLILVCLLWLVPTLGVFITSFRDSQAILTSGWWTIFPHKEQMDTGEIMVDENIDLSGDFEFEGITTNFQELREGVELPDGRFLTWYGNKRTRRVIVSDEKWVGFFYKGVTLKNYKDVLTGKEISFKNADGNVITRQGNDLRAAFLNSIAVTIPATVIPILIAAFRCLWVLLVEVPRTGCVVHHGGGYPGGTAADCAGAYSTGLHQTGLERHLPGHLAGTYGIWFTAGDLFVVQLHQHHPASAVGGGLPGWGFQLYHFHQADPAVIRTLPGFLCHLPVPVGLE